MTQDDAQPPREPADRFSALLQAARKLEAEKNPFRSVLSVYEAAIASSSTRAEAHHGAARLCRRNGLHGKAFELSLAGLRRSPPEDVPPAECWIYAYGLLLECSVSAFRIERFEDSLKLSTFMLNRNILSPDQAERVRMNAKQAEMKIRHRGLMPIAADGALAKLWEAAPAGSLGRSIRSPIASRSTGSGISRTIHIVWIGDATRRPEPCIRSWIDLNPAWNVVVWGNEELRAISWENAVHMRSMLTCELSGVADMMRWEILYHHGGFAVDADSVCVRPLEDWLFEPDVFASWESEIARPGLIANGYVYSKPGNRLIREIIDEIRRLPSVKDALAWKLTGPTRLTETVRKLRYADLTIYPSHFFMPRHHTGLSYEGAGPVFAKQFWGGTRANVYDELARGQVNADAGDGV